LKKHEVFDCVILNLGNNGQIQLWQFLLELLTDKEYQNIIQWLGDEGEFKLIHAEEVARLWGLRKNKPTMNYEKLSRALRYYYDGDMIAKVSLLRFSFCNTSEPYFVYRLGDYEQNISTFASRL